jgi:hypothetical protein
MLDNQSSPGQNGDIDPMIIQVFLPVKKYFVGKTHRQPFAPGSPI